MNRDAHHGRLPKRLHRLCHAGGSFVLLFFALPLLAPGAEENPCSNGSFERLAPGGFPADWAPLGRVEVTTNAHSGQRALRLVRAGEQLPLETGLNRGPLIRQLKGGMEFAYQAVSASNALLRVYVIPVNAEGIEKASASRTMFTVPSDQVGDGRWHHARVKYDYTGHPLVKSLHFAVRLEGAAGELWVDDFAYLERVGPILRAGTPRLAEDPLAPGRRGTVHVAVDNVGDERATGIRATVVLPPGLQASPLQLTLGNLAPGGRALPIWTIEGERTKTGLLFFEVACGDETNTVRLSLAPGLEVRSSGPASPVVPLGEQVVLACLLVNTGQVAVLRPSIEFSCGPARETRTTERLWPSESALLRASFPARRETTSLPVGVRVRAANAALTGYLTNARVIVSAPLRLPKPSGAVQARTSRQGAWLENEHLRLNFPRNSFGFGTGELLVRQPDGWRRVAWLPGLASEDDFQPLFCSTPPRVINQPAGKAGLVFEWTLGAGRASLSFELAKDDKTIRTCLKLTPAAAATLRYLEAPVVYVLDRDEALFPGVEWLVGDEVSSGALDIAAGHPDRIRHRVHPTWITVPAMSVHSAAGTVGLLWDPHQKWDGVRDQPGARFSSPDGVSGHRAHRLGLFLPPVPEFIKPNTWSLEPAKPCPLEPGKPLQIEALIYVDGEAPDSLSALEEWIRRFGIPEVPPPPRGSYANEIQFSMRGYLESLWVPSETNWWTSKGGGSMSGQGRPADFAADLLVGSMLSPDPAIRSRCRTQAAEVVALTGGPLQADAQRFPSGFAPLTSSGAIADLLGQRDTNGAWRFDADQVGSGPFVGADYHELGPDEAVELGTCSRKAFEVLRYARITGDREAFDAMQPTLRLMETFRVPRAAQVWEVPVHTPDILATAETMEAFIEAYRLTGDRRWLEDAVSWARRGLPFVYLWSDPERPFLLGASIPVFGATWLQGSWFGRPVQWNGLRYAEALLKLADYDRSQPWRQLAGLLVHSALCQQEPAGENVALWPDNIGAIQADKCPWLFAPRQILQNVLKLTGRDENPATVVVGRGGQRLHLTSTAHLEDAAWNGDRCSVQVTFPAGEQGLVLACNLARPRQVLVGGQPAPELRNVAQDSQSGWSYEEASGALTIRLTNDGPTRVEIEGAIWRPGQRLPRLAEHIDFQFRESADGWLPMHDVADLKVNQNLLEGRVVGGDPYLGRVALRVRGDECPTLRIRLRVTAGHTGQFYWSTDTRQGFSEERVLTFPLEADGQFHEYALQVGQHPGWSGQVINALRLDPGNGAREATFAVDYIRGERRPSQP